MEHLTFSQYMSQNACLLIMFHFLSVSSSDLDSLDSSAVHMSSSPTLAEIGILSPSPDPLPPPLPNPVNLCLPDHGQEEELIPVSDR